MRRWLPAVGLGGILALVAIVAIQPRSEPTLAERSEAIARDLRCPDCQGLSVADSPTRSAAEIRRQVDELLAASATDDEVREHFVARYGEWILLAPTAPAAWIIPFVVVATGALALGAWLSRRSPGMPRAAAPVSAEERRRLHEEAEALDA